MKKEILLTTLLFTFAVGCIAKDKMVSYNQVPVVAQQTLEQFYKKEDVSVVLLDDDWFRAEYEIIYQDGSKVKVDNNGKLIEAKSLKTPVPDVFIPQPILSHVHQHFTTHYIVEYEVKKYEYEIKLNNDIELTYDLKFQLIEVED